MPMENSFNPPPMWYTDERGLTHPIYNPTPEQWKQLQLQKERDLNERQMQNFTNFWTVMIGPMCKLSAVVIGLLVLLMVLK